MSGNNECGKEKKSLDVCDRGADHCSQHQYVQAGSLWRGSFSDIYEWNGKADTNLFWNAVYSG